MNTDPLAVLGVHIHINKDNICKMLATAAQLDMNPKSKSYLMARWVLKAYNVWPWHLEQVIEKAGPANFTQQYAATFLTWYMEAFNAYLEKLGNIQKEFTDETGVPLATL